MLVYGIDFTSAPSRSQPLTVAACELREGSLHLYQLLRIHSFDGFEKSLVQPGPWLAAMDFPFGLPRELVEELHWPTDWTACIEHVAALTRREFEDRLEFYMAIRPAGRKQLRRRTDVGAGALSPMKLHHVPLAKMFFEGACRLLASPLNILPCRPTDDERTVVEGYPGLAVRRLIGRRSYKRTGKGQQEQARQDARIDIASALTGEVGRSTYGFKLDIGSFVLAELVDDTDGDLLDAVLCASQAAWAYTQRLTGYGIPSNCDSLEGWIVDPANLAN